MRLSLFLLGSLLPFHALAVTINIDADLMKDANGNPMTGGVVVLAADVKDVQGPLGRVARNGFSGPTVNSFSGNDFLVHRWNVVPGSTELVAPGAFQASITIKLSGSWQAGDPLRLYWFPENTAADSAPGVGKHFGTYSSVGTESGSPGSFSWITPAESGTLTINGESASVPRESTVSLAFLSSDGSTLAPGAGLNGPVSGLAVNRMVVGRFVFYNNSAFDGNDSAANSADDAAIAPDKVPLFAGSVANFLNYTSYSKGLNGLMIDISNPANPAGISLGDFVFKVGNDNNVAGWSTAPAPASITRRAGAGVNGADRYTIVWADGVIAKTWLEVTVRASANTGLSGPDVFYFGNAIGEVGNSLSEAQVNVLDEIGARNNPKNVGNPATLSDLYDFNRDGRVNVLDQIVARNNRTSVLTALKLLSIP